MRTPKTATMDLMRPFFSYYGSRWQVAKKYTAPTSETVIEPFAGSAGYSVRHAPSVALLIDKNPEIIQIWRWLIEVPGEEILGLPDTVERPDDVRHLAEGPRNLIMLWTNKGRAEVPTSLSPWYFKYRNDFDCKVWGPAVKRRLVRQVERIRNWSANVGDYTDAPRIQGAHYHVDPPFSGRQGRRYQYSDIDYGALGDWCRGLPGFVQVCESADAEWLPFTPLGESETTRGKREGTKFLEGVWESNHAA